MVSRGLYGTTAYDAAARGISSDTSRTLAGIDAELAQARASLKMSAAPGLAGARYQIGNLYLERAAEARNLKMERYKLLLGIGPQGSDFQNFMGGAFSGLGSGLQMAGGMKMAGLF